VKKFYKSNYDYGREAEYIIAYIYILAGWKVWISPGSKGLADIKAWKYSKKDKEYVHHYIQVKSSRKVEEPYISDDEMDGLIQLSQRYTNVVPVLATLNMYNAVEILDLENWEYLNDEKIIIKK
jgi:hypothetical protein